MGNKIHEFKCCGLLKKRSTKYKNLLKMCYYDYKKNVCFQKEKFRNLSVYTISNPDRLNEIGIYIRDKTRMSMKKNKNEEVMISLKIYRKLSESNRKNIILFEDSVCESCNELVESLNEDVKISSIKTLRVLGENMVNKSTSSFTLLDFAYRIKDYVFKNDLVSEKLRIETLKCLKMILSVIHDNEENNTEKVYNLIIELLLAFHNEKAGLKTYLLDKEAHEDHVLELLNFIGVICKNVNFNQMFFRRWLQKNLSIFGMHAEIEQILEILNTKDVTKKNYIFEIIEFLKKNIDLDVEKKKDLLYYVLKIWEKVSSATLDQYMIEVLQAFFLYLTKLEKDHEFNALKGMFVQLIENMSSKSTGKMQKMVILIKMVVLLNDILNKTNFEMMDKHKILFLESCSMLTTNYSNIPFSQISEFSQLLYLLEYLEPKFHGYVYKILSEIFNLENLRKETDTQKSKKEYSDGELSSKNYKKEYFEEFFPQIINSIFLKLKKKIVYHSLINLGKLLSNISILSPSDFIERTLNMFLSLNKETENYTLQPLYLIVVLNFSKYYNLNETKNLILTEINSFDDVNDIFKDYNFLIKEQDDFYVFFVDSNSTKLFMEIPFNSQMQTRISNLMSKEDPRSSNTGNAVLQTSIKRFIKSVLNTNEFFFMPENVMKDYIALHKQSIDNQMMMFESHKTLYLKSMIWDDPKSLIEEKDENGIQSSQKEICKFSEAPGKKSMLSVDTSYSKGDLLSRMPSEDESSQKSSS